VASCGFEPKRSKTVIIIKLYNKSIHSVTPDAHYYMKGKIIREVKISILNIVELISTIPEPSNI
jgi:hypothetical protein